MQKRILIVEDDKIVNTLVEKALKKTYTVSTAANLVEARRRLIDGKLDLIVLDAELPDGDGFSFCSYLRKDPKFKDVPVLMLTGRAEQEEKDFAMKLGAADYMTKPFEIDQLELRVKAILDK